MSLTINRYISKIGIGLLIMFFFTSCEKEITIDLNSSEPKIVIEGLVELDSLATVRITKSKDYNTDNVYPPVNGATVIISDNAGNVETLKQNSAGLYCAEKIRGVVGYTYKLLVNAEGKEYTSTSKMPQFVEIDSLYMYYIPSFKRAFPIVRYQDIAGVDSYYHHILYVNGKRLKLEIDVTDDEQRDGFMIESVLPFDDKHSGDDKILKGDSITTELQCIDKGAYTFFETLGRIQVTQTNPTSNITGGALGYFSAYTSDTKSTIADWRD